MSTFYITSKSQDIMHYGVKGMKWGVRKEIKRLNQLDKENALLVGDSYNYFNKAATASSRTRRLRTKQSHSTKGSKQYNKYQKKIDKSIKKSGSYIDKFNASQAQIRSNRKETDRILKQLGDSNVSVVKTYKSRSTVRLTDQLISSAAFGTIPVSYIDGTRYKIGK